MSVEEAVRAILDDVRAGGDAAVRRLTERFDHAEVGPGELRVDAMGQSHTYQVGEAWYETGPDPVFAQAGERPTRFIRVMILPRACLGKSSLQFVDPADAAKPRAQRYQIFADIPIARPAGPSS